MPEDGKNVFRGGITFHPGTKALYAVVNDPTGQRRIVTIDWSLIDPAVTGGLSSPEELDFATQTSLFWDTANLLGGQTGIAFTPDTINPTLFVSSYTFGIFRFNSPATAPTSVFNGLNIANAPACTNGSGLVNMAVDNSPP